MIIFVDSDIDSGHAFR